MHRICLICDKAQVECLTHFADGMCISDRVSLSPLFSNIKRRQIFLTLVDISLFSYVFLRFGMYFSPIFSKAGYHVEG